MKTRIKEKNILKIPAEICIFYCYKKKIMLIKGPLNQKIIKLNTEIFISHTKRSLFVSAIPTNKTRFKQLKSEQGTTAALLKQFFFETSSVLYTKLNFVGVGYKAFGVANHESSLIMFRLGYSHNIYFKMADSVKISILKLTKLFVFGNSYSNVTLVASIIRKNKTPEPYKGKGIRYDNEKIALKEGKKV